MTGRFSHLDRLGKEDSDVLLGADRDDIDLTFERLKRALCGLETVLETGSDVEIVIRDVSGIVGLLSERVHILHAQVAAVLRP